MNIVIQEHHVQEGPKSIPKLTILHFNDVYDIQTKKGMGGVCNFKAKLQEFRQEAGENCLVLFSGDAFSPSILSRVSEGWQMVKALNSLNIDVACYGNHEFDYSQDHTIKLAQACNFPWLLGNIRNKKTGRILGNGIPYVIKTMPNGLKVGFFGVAGQDWISIMSQQYQGLFQCQDVQEYCQWMSTKLKSQQNCDVIIALTHMRNGDDLDLAEVPSQIDIILGGHDHVVMNRCVEGIPVIKSGSNFHHVGKIQIYQQSEQFQAFLSEEECYSPSPKVQLHKKYYDGKNFAFGCQIHQVPVAKPEKIDAQLKTYVDKQMEQYKKIDKLVGYAECPLQARFRVIRTQESNYGNFFADMFRLYFGTELALVNSGCIRNDLILPQGLIKLSKLSNVIDDKIIVKLIPGSAILKMLQYAVKGLPHSFMGSFLLVSEIKYTYDLSLTPRVQSVQLNGQPININRYYTVAIPSYMGNGGDGFDFIKQYRKIVDEVRGASVLTILLTFFQSLDEKVQQHDEHNDSHFHPNRSLITRADRIKQLRTNFFTLDNGERLPCICPETSQRIMCVRKQVEIIRIEQIEMSENYKIII